jgi:hypothetical protein
VVLDAWKEAVRNAEKNPILTGVLTQLLLGKRFMRCRGSSLADAIRDVHGSSMSLSRLVALLVGIALLTRTTDLLAQRGGGRGTRSRPFICVYDCREPSGGIDLTNSELKRFDQLMAVQATTEQSAAFARTQQDVQDAAKQLKTFQQLLEKNPTTLQPSEGSTLCQFLDKARTSNHNFLASFSDAQKVGLKEIIAKLVSADSDLGEEMTAFNGMFQPCQAPADVAGVAERLDRDLASLQREQLALAREMSILPSGEKDLTFHLPQVTISAEIAGQQVSMTVAGEAIRSSVSDGRSLFDLRFVVDLSDLQDDITAIFRSQLTSAPRCGQHVEVQQAMLLPRDAGTLAVLHLHHERWICPSGAGGGGELLVAAGNAIVEIKLVPSADPTGKLHLAAEVGRVDSDEVFRDWLVTGTVGSKLAEEVSNVVLSALKRATDLGTILPPAAQQAVTIQKAQFQAGGAGQLRLVLDGQLRFSDEEIKEFAVQLRQQLSAQATPSQ